jgi:hypothetical protein
MDLSFLSCLLPCGLLDHFDIIDFKELCDINTKKNCFFIHLDEKNILQNLFKKNKTVLLIYNQK